MNCSASATARACPPLSPRRCILRSGIRRVARRRGARDVGDALLSRHRPARQLLRRRRRRHIGRAHWDAHYTFSRTGRPVHNSITAGFAFKDGLIARHADRFSFWRWSRQALGPVGLWLGWTPLLRARVRANARAGLKDWVRNGGQDHSRICTAPSRMLVNTTAGDHGQVRLKETWQRRSG